MFQLSSAIPVARWNTPWRLQEIDAIIKDFFAGRLLAKPLAAGEDAKGKSRQAETERPAIYIENA